MEILRVKDILSQKGITQKELAGRLGIHPVTLSQNLSRNPTLAYLQRIADTLEVDLLDLFVDNRIKKDEIILIYRDEMNKFDSAEELKRFLDNV